LFCEMKTKRKKTLSISPFTSRVRRWCKNEDFLFSSYRTKTNECKEKLYH